jgi:hypothetical protein
MENANEEVQRWVERQIAYLDPPEGWEPDASAALGRFRGRNRPSRQLAWAVAAALAIAVLPTLPAGRAVAQQIWQFLTVRRVGIIRVNPWPEGVPSPQINFIGPAIPPIPARDIEEAGRRVRYAPRLPRPGVLSGSPKLYTTFSLAEGTVVKVGDLEAALHKAGVTDQAVPQAWDGAHLALHTSGVVIAQWPDIVLAQSLPLTLSAPPNFDFPAFSALLLRVLGVRPEEAKKLAEQMGTAPPWLAPLSRDFAASLSLTMEEITLNSGPATLIGQPQPMGGLQRITVVWSVSDRVYLLSGNVSRELTIAAANAVE